jgi:hypothetical protein
MYGGRSVTKCQGFARSIGWRHEPRRQTTGFHCLWRHASVRFDRLIEPRKGSDSGSNFSRVAGSQHWALNAIGNWNSFDTDLNNDGSYSSSNDRVNAGTFSDANEITQIQRTIATAKQCPIKRKPASDECRN